MNPLLLFFVALSIVLLVVIIIQNISTKRKIHTFKLALLQKNEQLKAMLQTETVSSDDSGEKEMQSRLDMFRQFMPGAGEKDTLLKSYESLIRKIATEFEASQGAFYLHTEKEDKHLFRFVAGFAFYVPDSKPIEFELGEGLAGQVAKDKKMLNIDSVPFEHIPVFSGLGKEVPHYLIICPVVTEDITKGIIELASFKPFSKEQETLLGKIAGLMTEHL